MGLFTSKIAAGVVLGSFTLAGAGLVFTGTGTLQQATDFVKEAGSKLTQFEGNEKILVSKINTLRDSANSKINEANSIITGKKAEINKLNENIKSMTSEKDNLTADIASLKQDITGLQANLKDSNTNLEATRTALNTKTNEYNSKVAELNATKEKIANYEGLLKYAEQKAEEADKLVAQLEKEIQKANAEVKAHGEAVNSVKEQTKDDQPLSQKELDALDTTLKDVNSGAAETKPTGTGEGSTK
ncbi:hypothetical protein [Peribacillus sp. FSL E2-0218]|uniref:hypothetical protein n=1 Tax=Peribacillus sp. FSL E2-0218 TaxID=2921364 RepID=UPI0030EEB72A